MTPDTVPPKWRSIITTLCCVACVAFTFSGHRDMFWMFFAVEMAWVGYTFYCCRRTIRQIKADELRHQLELEMAMQRLEADLGTVFRNVRHTRRFDSGPQPASDAEHETGGGPVG